MRRSGRSGVGLVVLAGAVAAAAAPPAAWRSPAAAGDRLDVLRRQAEAAVAFNRTVAAELAAGRLSLADAADRVTDANADRPGYLDGLRGAFDAPTPRERVALTLVYRVEHPPAAAPAANPALRAAYAALFGRPYAPPAGSCDG